MMDLKNIVRQNILDLQPYSSARDEFKGKEGVFLDANENPYGTLNRYPDPQQKELKKKLAEMKDVSSQNIFIGNGSDEVIDLAFRIFCNPGTDKALTFSPTYGMYKVSAAINNVDILEVPLTPTFQIDLEKVIPLFNDKQIKLLFICSPNNPTGNTINMDAILFILENFKGIVIIDEAYIDFSSRRSCLKYLSSYNNLIVSQTMSKAWGLAAARVGIAYANQEIIKLYNKVKPPYNVSKLNQDAALKALDNYDAFLSYKAEIISEKKRVAKALGLMDLVQHIYPSDSNFLLVKMENANDIYTKLAHQSIVVRNRNTLVANCLRISIGTPEENNQLIEALNKV